MPPVSYTRCLTEFNDGVIDETQFNHPTRIAVEPKKEILDDEGFKNWLKKNVIELSERGGRSDPETLRTRMSQEIVVMFMQKPRKSYITDDTQT